MQDTNIVKYLAQQKVGVRSRRGVIRPHLLVLIRHQALDTRSPKWAIRYRDPDGDWVGTKVFATRKKAQAAYDTAIARHQRQA